MALEREFVHLLPRDVKLVGDELGRFAQYGEKGVLALFSDSTNVEKEGYTLSESDVRETLEDIFQNCDGRLIIAVFASNITRIQQVILEGRIVSKYQ